MILVFFCIIGVKFLVCSYFSFCFIGVKFLVCFHCRHTGSMDTLVFDNRLTWFLEQINEAVRLKNLSDQPRPTISSFMRVYIGDQTVLIKEYLLHKDHSADWKSARSYAWIDTSNGNFVKGFDYVEPPTDLTRVYGNIFDENVLSYMGICAGYQRETREKYIIKTILTKNGSPSLSNCT